MSTTETMEAPDQEVHRLLTEIFQDIADHRRAKITAALGKILGAQAQLYNVGGTDAQQFALGAIGQNLSQAVAILRDYRDTEIKI